MQALVIDDSRAMRRILVQILQSIGFQVLEAGHGKEGLERLKQNPRPAVTLVDWNMPEMNGYEFLQAVRADHDYDAMPIMMVTTETEMTQVEKALTAGANEYVMKPFTREVILQKLELMGVVQPANA